MKENQAYLRHILDAIAKIELYISVSIEFLAPNFD